MMGKLSETGFIGLKDGQDECLQNNLLGVFATSKQNIGQHITNVLEEKELNGISVVKNFFTTAADGKQIPASQVEDNWN